MMRLKLMSMNYLRISMSAQRKILFISHLSILLSKTKSSSLCMKYFKFNGLHDEKVPKKKYCLTNLNMRVKIMVKRRVLTGIRGCFSNLKTTKLCRSKNKMKTITCAGTGECNLLRKKVTPSIAIEKRILSLHLYATYYTALDLNRKFCAAGMLGQQD